MLALVEPYIFDQLCDRPHLGSAMLIAACENRQIPTRLIKGQTRCLADMCCRDGARLWALLCDPTVRVQGYAAEKLALELRKLGEAGLQDHLRMLYQRIIREKSATDFFNTVRVQDLQRSYWLFNQMYQDCAVRAPEKIAYFVDRYVEEVFSESPRVVGISLYAADPLTVLLCRRIKAVKNVPIVLGGAVVSKMSTERVSALLSEMDGDYAVIGPGEATLPALVRRLEQGREGADIPGVMCRRAGKLAALPEPVRSVPPELPVPDYEQFDLDLYLSPVRVLPVQSARGCSWRQCAFCDHHISYCRQYSSLSADCFSGMIAALRDRYACTHFILHDEDIPAGRMRRLCETLCAGDFSGLSFQVYARPSLDFAEESLLNLMSQAGIRSVLWGVESGAQRILDRMRKGTTVSTVSRILRTAATCGIANACFIMIGFPGETTEEAEATVAFLKEHAGNIHAVMVSHFCLNEYSAIGEFPEQWGIEKSAADRYRTTTGATIAQSQRFADNLQKLIDANAVSLFDVQRRFLLYEGHYVYSAVFVLQSYRLAQTETVSGLFGPESTADVFPVMAGEVIRSGETLRWRPLNIRESCFINRVSAPPEMELTGFWGTVLMSANGENSLQQIIAAACGGDAAGDDDARSIREFFWGIAQKQYALFFLRRWDL